MNRRTFFTSLASLGASPALGVAPEITARFSLTYGQTYGVISLDPPPASVLTSRRDGMTHGELSDAAKAYW